MQPGNYNIELQQGDTYQSVITWTTAATSDPSNRTPGTPVDVTGASAALNIYQGRSLVLAVTPQSNANGSSLTLGGSAGTISILISAADSTSLPALCDGYALVITQADGTVTTLLTGSVLVSEAL